MGVLISMGLIDIEKPADYLGSWIDKQIFCSTSCDGVQINHNDLQFVQLQVY